MHPEITLVASGTNSIEFATSILVAMDAHSAEMSKVSLEVRQGLTGVETLALTVAGAVLSDVARRLLDHMIKEAPKLSPETKVIVILGGKQIVEPADLLRLTQVSQEEDKGQS